MADMNCPYCKAGCNINEPMSDDEEQEIECPACEREFVVTASVSILYKATCREADHDWGEAHEVDSVSHTGWFAKTCSRCDESHVFKKGGA